MMSTVFFKLLLIVTSQPKYSQDSDKVPELHQDHTEEHEELREEVNVQVENRQRTHEERPLASRLHEDRREDSHQVEHVQKQVSVAPENENVVVLSHNEPAPVQESSRVSTTVTEQVIAKESEVEEEEFFESHVEQKK